MPICENCERDKNEVLEIILPKSLRRKTEHGDFRHRIKAKLCFICIKLYAESALDFNGYWHTIVFPQQHRMLSK